MKISGGNHKKKGAKFLKFSVGKQKGESTIFDLSLVQVILSNTQVILRFSSTLFPVVKITISDIYFDWILLLTTILKKPEDRMFQDIRVPWQIPKELKKLKRMISVQHQEFIAKRI